jgi:hypothetical protein
MKATIKTTLSLNDIFERFSQSGFENLGAKPFCSTYIYLDNGEGSMWYVPVHIKADDNGTIQVFVTKSEIPFSYKEFSEQILEDGIEKVQGALYND